jgi:hypothetical protein
MKRMLALTMLVLFAMGLAFQLRADPQRWQCPNCDLYNTWSRHDCPYHDYFWYPCSSEGANPPPQDAPCPICSLVVTPDLAKCFNFDCWTAAPLWP